MTAGLAPSLVSGWLNTLRTTGNGGAAYSAVAGTFVQLHTGDPGAAGTDLAGMPVRLAVVAHRASPVESEWRTAAWSGTDARLLIGPDTDTVLVAGDYRVWINIDPPGSEDIVRPAGILTVT